MARVQFLGGGPDIPERLLQAHEEGHVVFFCGAGISFAAGLPSFKALTEQLFERLLSVPNSVQSSAMKKDRYDVAITLLEADHVGRRRSVRDAVRELLEPDLTKTDAMTTHEALLTLAQGRSGSTRLVTTNFDRLFEHVVEVKRLVVPRFVAPHLPIPKQRWDGLVYLHGLLTEDARDAGFDNLVIGSGDFGLAYLTERWAARFVSELFKNFSVCFVGYSLDDPVLRYMTDAIAADRRYGESSPEMFALAHFTEGGEEETRSEWKAKGVTPITYASRDGHVLLHASLRAWADIYRDGLLGKERVVAELAGSRPTRTTEQDDHIGRMLWALSDATGLPAKRFAEHEPRPPLEWLEVMSEPRYDSVDLRRFGAGRGRGQQNDIRFSFLERPISDDAGAWSSLVAHQAPWPRIHADLNQIGRWLARHLDDPKLALWVANRGGVPHPVFARHIERALDDPIASPSAAARALWRVVLAGRVRARASRPEIFDWRRRFSREGLTTTARLELKELLKPKLLLRERFALFNSGSPSEEPEKAVDLVGCELVLATDHVRSGLEELNDNDSWVRAMPDLLADLTGLLRDTMDLAATVGLAGPNRDLTFMAQPSISEHEQNHDLHDWTVLITLCRDAWSALADSAPERAIHVAHGWMKIPYPVFKRLAFFAATRQEVVSGEVALRWLSCDDGRWLWSPESQREALQLVTSIVSRDNGQLRAEMEQLILAGPPVSQYGAPPEPSASSAPADHATWLRLLRVSEAGTSPSSQVTARLEELRERHPEWATEVREKDEFPVWMDDVEWGPTRRTPSRRSELVAWLREHPKEDRLSDDDWFDRCRDDPSTTVAALCELAQGGTFPVDRWRAALNAWSTDALAVRTWNRLAPIIAAAPPSLIADSAREASRWLMSAAHGVERHTEIFLKLCREILELDHEGDPKSGTPMLDAVNHPVGHVTEAMLRWWLRAPVQDNQGLPEEIRPMLIKICEEEDSQYVHGRVLLAAYAITLYRVDDDWARRYLLPRFDWQRSLAEARAVWDGFLHAGRLYRPFLEETKGPFLDTAGEYEHLGDKAERYAALLTHAALARGDTFDRRELATAFRQLPEAGLAAAARALAQALNATEDQKAEFWANRVMPFLTSIWPSTRDAAKATVSEQLAEVCIAAGDSFEAAVEQLGDWLQPTRHSGYLIHRLRESGLGISAPSAALDFLSRQVELGQTWLPHELRACLDAIEGAQPEIATDARFVALLEMLRQSEG